MPRKGIKANWPVISARIPPELKIKILQKHPKYSELNALINCLLQKYIEGKIFGVKLEV